MRGLRKSLKSDKPDRRGSSTSLSHSRMSSFNGTNSASFTAALVASSSTSLQAQQVTKESPKKIIRAIADYAAQNKDELSFKKGDFFWVTGREMDVNYYEVHNPAQDLKGLVPVAAFEVVSSRRRPDSVQHGNSFIISNLHLDSSGSVHSSPVTSPASVSTASFAPVSSMGSGIGGNLSGPPTPGNNPNTGILYGVVMYDFEARPDSDELDVAKGEYLILCAHHEYEWFIAKPINRLGGPGLVPVAYVKTLNLATKEYGAGDIVDQISQAGLPTVSQWKSKAARYKAASISLEESPSSSVPVAPVGKTLYECEDATTASSSVASIPVVVDVKIDNVYHNQPDDNAAGNGKLWYHVVARLSSHRIRSLARFHEDFMELYTSLAADLNPVDAAKLPSLPAPMKSQARLEYWSNFLATVISISDKPAAFEANFYSIKPGVDKEFHETDESIELPSVGGYNEDGRDRMVQSAAVSSSAALPSTPGTQATGGVQGSSTKSTRSSADTRESQLSYQMGQLNLKTSSVSTNATSTSEAVTPSTITNVEEPGIIANSDQQREKPALKISTAQAGSVPYGPLSSAVTPGTAVSAGGTSYKNMKIKLYYEDDIYAVSVSTNSTLEELKVKIGSRINHGFETIKLFVKGNHITEFSDDDDLSKEIDTDEFLRSLMKKDPKLKLIVITDEK